MEDRVYLINLYDYYGKLLTEKQRMYFEDYYFDNLTMEEIAENDNVSKNAISKQIINKKEKLKNNEELLKIYKNKLEIEKILKEDINKIIDYI